MSHENARKGLGKVFTGEILQIIAAILLCISAGIGAISAMAGSEGGLVVAGIGFVLVLVVGSIFEIIAFILNLVGLSQAGKDSSKIKTAFTVSIISLLLIIVFSILSTVFAQYSWIQTIGNLVQEILALVIVYMVLMGAAELNSALADKANSTWKIYLIVVILGIVASIVVLVFGMLNMVTVAGVAYIVITVVDYILSIIGYIMFLTFLARAKNEV